MERIINYMDEAILDVPSVYNNRSSRSTLQEHFAAGRDLAEARALPDDSGLQKSNAEGFVSEEECLGLIARSQRSAGIVMVIDLLAQDARFQTPGCR